MNEDFRDVLVEMVSAGARFPVVGAHAPAVHGIPRATGDLDLWVECDAGNARRLLAAGPCRRRGARARRRAVTVLDAPVRTR